MMSFSAIDNNKKRKKISIKQLESHLQESSDFKNPKIDLEQYGTPPHIAALMLNTIDSSYGEIESRLVADLGCGTGRLSIGSLLCGAKLVYGFDVDESALICSLDNINYTFGDSDDESVDSDVEVKTGCEVYKSCNNFQLIQVDLATTNCDTFWSSFRNYFDTVIMNPPFGTKHNQGLDIVFLKRGIDISNDVVYSLHKTSTRNVSLIILLQH